MAVRYSSTQSSTNNTTGGGRRIPGPIAVVVVEYGTRTTCRIRAAAISEIVGRALVHGAQIADGVVGPTGGQPRCWRRAAVLSGTVHSTVPGATISACTAGRGSGRTCRTAGRAAGCSAARTCRAWRACGRTGGGLELTIWACAAGFAPEFLPGRTADRFPSGKYGCIIRQIGINVAVWRRGSAPIYIIMATAATGYVGRRLRTDIACGI